MSITGEDAIADKYRVVRGLTLREANFRSQEGADLAVGREVFGLAFQILQPRLGFLF